MKNAAEITILYDADKAGREGAAKLATHLKGMYPEKTVKHFAAEGDTGTDLTDVVEAAQARGEDPRAAARTWLEHGLANAQEAEPPPEPAEPKPEYPAEPGGRDLSAWILAGLGAEWTGRRWIGMRLFWIEEESKFIYETGGVFRPADFPRYAEAVVRGLKDAAAKHARRIRRAMKDLEGSGEAEDETGESAKAKQRLARLKYQLKIASDIVSDYRRQGTVNDALQSIRRSANRKAEEFDQPGLIAGLSCGMDTATERLLEGDLEGGAVDTPTIVFELETGRRRQARPEDRIRRTLGVELIPETTDLEIPETTDLVEILGGPQLNLLREWCPQVFDALLKMSEYQPPVAEGTEEPPARQADLSWVAAVLETIGICMIGDPVRSFSFLTGPGANGKGIVAGMILELAGQLGHRGQKGLMNPYTSEGSHTQGKMGLRNRHVVVWDEVKRVDIDELKDWSGGGLITGSVKYGPEVTFKPRFHPLLLSNKVPNFGEVNFALTGRLVAIPFDTIFGTQEHVDTGEAHRIALPEEVLKTKLRADYPLLILIALAAGRAASRRGHRWTGCTRIKAKSRLTAVEANRVWQFVQECLIPKPGAEEATEKLHDRFMEWQKEAGLKLPKTRNAFGKELRDALKQTGWEVKDARVKIMDRETRVKGVKGVQLKPRPRKEESDLYS